MKTDAKSLLKIGTAVFLLYLCIHYWTGISGFLLTVAGTAFPLTLGCVIAYLINILMSWFERHYFPNSARPAVTKSRRIVCMIAAILSMLAIVALIVWLVLPQLIDCIMLIINILPGAIEKLLAQI